MNTKIISILLVVLLVLTGIVVYPFISEKISEKAPIQTNTQLPFPMHTIEDTSRVTIRTEKNEVELIKDSDNWKVASHSASQDLISAFFSALKETRVGVVVSKNSVNSAEYNVATDSGTYVTFTSSSGQQTYILGKEGPETGSFYAKNENDDSVFIVYGPLKEAVKTRIDDWRNKIIVNFSQNAVNSIIVSGVNGFTLTKKEDGKWQYSKPDATRDMEESEISTIFAQFTPLEGREFLNTTEEKEFASAKKETISIKDKENKILSEISFIEKEADYWMKRSDSAETLKVSGYKLQNLFRIQEKQ